MEEQYFIVNINVFRESSCKMLTLPGVLEVGVTAYRFLQYKSTNGSREQVQQDFIAPYYNDCSVRPQTVFVSTNMENHHGRDIREEES